MKFAILSNFTEYLLMTNLFTGKIAQASLLMFAVTGSAVAVLPAVDVSQATNATATVDEKIHSQITASIVAKNAQGQEVLQPVNAQTKLETGNILEYHGYITNNSPERIRNMKVTFSIPDNMELLNLVDISPIHPQGSIDGKAFHYMPIRVQIGGVSQELPLKYYKAIQWEVKGLGLNEVALVKYRVKVK